MSLEKEYEADRIKRIERVLNLTHKNSITVTIPRLTAERAVSMLKEQEEVTPYIDIDEAKCPICKVKLTRQELIGDDVLFEDYFDYCPHCGRQVKWG